MSKQKIEANGLTFTWNNKCNCYQFNLPPVQSCPGVGERLKNPKSICNYCYAKYGRFGQMESAQKVLQENLRIVKQRSYWSLFLTFHAMILRIPALPEYFRWFGCGDLVSTKMASVIYAIARSFPGVQFWCPTQSGFNMKPRLPNLSIRHTQSIIGLPAPAGGHTTLFPEQKRLKGHYVCPGECEGCRKCWEPWNPKTRIAFPFHGSACLMAKFNKARRIYDF